MKAKQYDLEERLLDYAAAIIRLVEQLPNTRAGNHVASQLLRSGTSPLPNHREAQAAESRNDFIHKLSICLKELKESRRWLRLIKRVPFIDPPEAVEPLLEETEELIRIFASSIRTAQRNANDSSELKDAFAGIGTPERRLCFDEPLGVTPLLTRSLKVER